MYGKEYIDEQQAKGATERIKAAVEAELATVDDPDKRRAVAQGVADDALRRTIISRPGPGMGNHYLPGFKRHNLLTSS